MSIFINSDNFPNTTIVAANNKNNINESNYNEMGSDVGKPNRSSMSCAFPTATPLPSAADYFSPPKESQESENQQFVEIAENSKIANRKSLQDQGGGTDSGRESVNEFDSSLEDTQLSKKPCTGNFYASDDKRASAQTKWFVDFKSGTETNCPESVALADIPVTVIALEDIGVDGVGGAEVVGNGKQQGWQRESSFSENQLFSKTDNKTTTTTSSTTRLLSIDNGIRVIGDGSFYTSDYQRLEPISSNLTQQLRAVSSPSLTEITQDAKPIKMKAAVTKTSMTSSPSPSPTKTAPSSSSIIDPTVILPSTEARSRIAANQNIGVLQKFKRTFATFNSNRNHQQQPSSSSSSTNGIILSSPATEQGATSIVSPTSNLTHTATHTTTNFSIASKEGGCIAGAGGCSGTALLEQSQDVDQFTGKYRFGPLIWRASKERRKTKCNRRDKCNSGDSGIQIELDNDEQFAGVISGQSDAANSGIRGKVPIASHKSTRIRRVNSAKASSLSSCSNNGEGHQENDKSSAGLVMTSSPFTTSSLLPKRGHPSKTNLEELDACNWFITTPTSLPARSLSQPTGLDRLLVPSVHFRTNTDPDESDTDSVSSSQQDCNEAIDRHRLIFAEALYNFTSAGPQELSLRRGDLIEILRKEVGPWWYGRKRNGGVIETASAMTTSTFVEPQLGWFPKDFVRVVFLPEMGDLTFSLPQQQQQRTEILPKPLSPVLDKTLVGAADSSSSTDITITGNISGTCSDNNVTTIVIDPDSEINSLTEKDRTLVYSQTDTMQDQPAAVTTPSLPLSQSVAVLHDNTNIMRNSAVKELYNTEVNYVKLLSAICRGYLPAMSKRIDIFTPESIRLIFSNIENIFEFQQEFLEALSSGIKHNTIADVFLENQSGFLVYSTYCNSYPRALIELETYSRNKDARTVMENCRLAENLPELPLSAHLLAPVQRICRYPLHLAELIKNCVVKANDETVDIKDEIDSSLHKIVDTKETLENALKAMKNVTEAVNEGKRHSENLARHQSNFENFSGPPIHFHSTRYFMQIDATRVSPNLWNNTYTLFLFDHQLIYCKKDILKRQHFIYKGRIFLDSCRILNLPDGKIFGANVKNALRIYCDARNKWFDFSFRSANRKRRFLTTLALERQFCGKNLFISELAANDETTDERDLSDREYHSDYETTVSGRRSRRDNRVGVAGSHRGGGVSDVDGGSGSGGIVEASDSSLNLQCKENIYGVVSGGSGSSSVPESPTKQQYKFCDTLPKQTTRQTSATLATNGGKESIYDYSTSSLGRRRLGNWFRKSKSTNSTPNQSPTHQPSVLGGALQTNSDNSSLSSPALGGFKSKELTSSVSS